VSVIDVAFLRALAVTAGVLCAAFVSRFWWPAEARRELSKALGELSIGSLVCCNETYIFHDLGFA
jgi:hypothetical protein